MFSRYHYLDHKHNNSAKVFVAFIDGQLAGFCSVIHHMHPIAKNLKRIHRLVVLPEYQGAGLGMELLQRVGDILLKEGNRCTITTSQPALVFAFKKSTKWRCMRYGRVKRFGKSSKLGKNNAENSVDRITTSWEYKGNE